AARVRGGSVAAAPRTAHVSFEAHEALLAEGGSVYEAVGKLREEQQEALRRTLAAAIFILMPITPMSVIVFSVVMGSLWLATVPLTSGLVAHLYGLRYMGTLYGIVFFSHQLGSFLGVWLGGRMYDLYGDYTLVWWVGVGVGAFSAIVHLPIRENRTPEAVAA
ncbi:MAG: hypothetical protein VX228_07590, partial [Pseudomonadota bacterium]|nr:hypothetical protein [Pseudomonadota bacterium]